MGGGIIRVIGVIGVIGVISVISVIPYPIIPITPITPISSPPPSCKKNGHVPDGAQPTSNQKTIFYKKSIFLLYLSLLCASLLVF